MRWRDFITMAGATAASWPVAARAQQSALPVVGFISGVSADASARFAIAFREGLNETGAIEGKTVTVEYYWLGGQFDHLPALVGDLVRRQVAVIATPAGTAAAVAAKAATAIIPIVFALGEDPVHLGLVAGLARPGANVTGINFFSVELVAKRLRLLRDLVPKAVRLAVLVNPANTLIAGITSREVREAAPVIGLQVQILNATTIGEIDAAFATLARDRPDALFVAGDAFFTGRRSQIVALTARERLPAAYSQRDYVQAGGLMSYGTDLAEAFHQVGIYTGAAIDQIRVRAQPQDRKGARPRRAAGSPVHCRRGDRVRRREFIAALAVVGALPLAARAQQQPLPVVAFVRLGSPETNAPYVAAFRKGLNETGYVEGQNVAIEYHWLEQYDRLPALMTDLVRRQMAVIATANDVTALAAKAATATIPIVFGVGGDPVQLGLVASLARPGGNATGINFFNTEVTGKRLRLLHDLVPKAVRIAVLVNPANSVPTEATLRDVQEAAPTIRLQIQILNASIIGEIDAAFAALARDRPDALFVAGDAFFVSRRGQFATLTAVNKIPAAYGNRDHVVAGGLMSYGTDLADMHHQVGVYTGEILKGAKPADLPVLQATKFEFVLNLQTARALGIEVPPSMLSIADEVIE